PHAETPAVSLVAQPIVDPLQRPGHQPGKLTGHIPKQGGLQFQQGKAELAAKLVHDEKPLPVDFFADTTRSEDRLLTPAFSSRRRPTRCTAWAVTAHLSRSLSIPLRFFAVQGLPRNYRLTFTELPSRSGTCRSSRTGRRTRRPPAGARSRRPPPPSGGRWPDT